MKIIKKKQLSNANAFLGEIEVLKKISQSNIPKYFECFEDAHNLYIVTEFCSGGELVEFLLEEGNMGEIRIAVIMS